jgi:myb proto-oncogene protein
VYKLNPTNTQAAWSKEEDEILKAWVKEHGTKTLNIASREVLLGRTSHHIRDRWFNYLNPKIDKSPFTIEEEFKVLVLFQIFGTNWSLIQYYLPHRSARFIHSKFRGLKCMIKGYL